MEFYEVYVYQYGTYFSTIWVHAKDREHAEEEVEALNALDGASAFSLTGLVQEK